MEQSLVATEFTASMDFLSPELWGRPVAEAKVDRLFVVGPYPTLGFFQRLDKLLRPAQLVLVVDEGWNAAEIEKLRGYFKRRLLLRYAACAGLVHAKLYFVEWSNGAAGRRSRQLLWGSANASVSGFGSARNAEVLSAWPVRTNGPDRALIGYFEQFTQAAGTTTPQDIALPSGLRLLLPSFEFRSDPTPQSFDAWVQAGYLCHQYVRDQGFGRLSIQLKQPLPPGELTRIFERNDFRAETESKSLRRAYVKGVTRAARLASPKWRSRYFVETWLGHWTSGECFRAKEPEFVGPDADRRERVLDEVARASETKRGKWIEKHLAVLQRIATQLASRRHAPSDYLHCERRSDTRIDRALYEEQALRQIRRHQQQAGNELFRQRFKAAYEFRPLPSFRGADAEVEGSFKDFLISLCDGMLTSLNKARVTNLLAARVRDAIDEANEEDGDTLAEMLEKYTADGGDGDVLRALLAENWHLLETSVRSFWESPA